MYITLVLGKCPIVPVPTTKDLHLDLPTPRYTLGSGFVHVMSNKNLSILANHDSFVSRYSTRRVELYVWSIHLSEIKRVRPQARPPQHRSI